MTALPSGEQIELRAGEHTATVVEVGAGLRRYEVAGRPVIDPYPADAMCDGGHGAVLLPWPNRLGGGRYRFDGVDHQLALSEPSAGNAIHGLTRWASWRVADRSDAHVVMAMRLHPQTGYPFLLDLTVRYALDAAAGLTVTTSAHNVGAQPLPYGTGQHPYLSPGPGRLEEATVTFTAGRTLTVDAHALPIGTEPVAGGPLDFAAGRPIGEQVIDAGFCDLPRDADGRAWVHMRGADGATVSLWAGAAYTYLQLFTGDTLAPDRRRLGLAVEPMTCPADAFRTGTALIRLQPGEQAASTWGVTLA